MPVLAAERGALHEQGPTQAAGTGPKAKVSSASLSKSTEPRLLGAVDRAIVIYRRTATAIIANFTFIFKNGKKVMIFLMELLAKVFGEPQQCCVATFRLQQEVFVIAAEPVRHSHRAEQNPWRFVVTGSQVSPTTAHR